MTTDTARRVLSMARDMQADINAITAPEPEGPTAEEQLRRIAGLRGDLVEIESEIALAKVKLEGTREYAILQDLKAERKDLLLELDTGLVNAMRWTQRRMFVPEHRL